MTARFILAGLAVLAIAFAPSGCGQDCTLVGYVSVLVTMLDEQGEVIEDVSVSFTLDGERTGDCTPTGSGGRHACGLEAEGEFMIVAEAPGYEMAMTTVSVGADECHVDTESVDLTLVAVP